MLAPEVARTHEILSKRVRRLLRLDRGEEDQSELSAKVLPFLRVLGAPILIGGAVRDVARAGRQGFSSDLDFVICDGRRERFLASMQASGALPNKFGGFALRCFRWKVDVWHIDDTWAKTSGLVHVSQPRDLLRCTFFDWDSALYDVDSGKLILAEGYLDKLQLNVMDVQLEENPNPRGSLVRALRRAALWRVGFGPGLTSFSVKMLERFPWSSLVEVDNQAFSLPVLRHLDEGQVLGNLSKLDANNVTFPVQNWTRQLRLPTSTQSISPPRLSMVGG